MRLLQAVSVLFLASCLAMGQTQSPAADDPNSVAAEIKALREAVAAQQRQIAEQQKQLEQLQQAAAPQQDSTSADAGRLVNASLNTNSPVNVSARPPQEKPKESPLSIRIGGADFTPGGFMDFENIFRSTNTGNVAGTNFWAIPYSNTVAGHLTEFRSTGQYSRFNLKVHTKFGDNDVTGFAEADFNGNDPANQFVTSNSHTFRIRHYWVQVRRNKWEFVGGQVWGLLTANRVGVSPASADVFTTFNEDGNHNIGNNFTRSAQFRVAYHFNDKVVWAVALENPQQFTGQGAEVVFPTAFNAQLGGQFDAGNNAGTPNLFPDIISKLAFDNKFAGDRQFHFEVGGLLTGVKITNLPTIAGSTFKGHSAVGGGIEGGVSVDIVRASEGRFARFVANGLWGPGVGRYLLGTGPNAVVAPINTNGGVCTSVGNCDLAISMVHAGNALVGFEFVPLKNSQFGAYYGGAYFQRNAFLDLTSPLAIKPVIGFGGIGEANAGVQNRSIQEGTLDWIQTLWRNPQYGALQLVTQASYITRSPWFAPAGAPKNAHLGMGYVSLKYILP